MLKTGQADFTEVNWPAVKQVQGDPTLNLVSLSGTNYLMMAFLGLPWSLNSGSEPGHTSFPQGWPEGTPSTDLHKVREAMLRAIDFDRLNDIFYSGQAELTPFYRTTKASILYDASDPRFKIPFLEPDLEVARQLMAEAGFPVTCSDVLNRPGKPDRGTHEVCEGAWEQSLWVPTTSGSYGTAMLDVAAIIADDWAKLGISAVLKPMDNNNFRFKYFTNKDPHIPDGWGGVFLGISSADPFPGLASRYKRGEGRNQMYLSQSFEDLFAAEDAAETFEELVAAKLATNYETAKVFAEHAVLLHGIPYASTVEITGWQPYPGNSDASGHNWETLKR
jgi:ABC-type transport system substrate-binding protein